MEQIAEDRGQRTDREMDEAKAVAELSALSKDARLWLMDRIGNGLGAISNYNAMGMTHKVAEAVERMMEDFYRTGLFPLRQIRGF